MGSDKYRDISVLDNLYMLDSDEPSEAWTAAAKSPYSRPVEEYLDRGAEALHSAQMLGYVLIFGWGAIFLGIVWFIWRRFHG